MPDLLLRAATSSESDVKLICTLLHIQSLEMHTEDFFPVDPDKALREVFRVCQDEAAWMVFEEDRLVASAGVTWAEAWMSDQPFLTERWLYILPDYRGKGSKATDLLLSEVRALVDATGLLAEIRVFNPKQTISRLTLARFADDLYIAPAGGIHLIRPSREGRHG